MGLFGTKTKADWDEEIIRLQKFLANNKATLAVAKQQKNTHSVAHIQRNIEIIKADIAEAKIKRKNAPK